MDNLIQLIDEYLKIFPEEKNRQRKVIQYLKENSDITDWNNFNGHIVVGGFIYAKKEKKFLVLYHKDLKMFLYPGGHIDNNDLNTLEAAKREIYEETGLKNLKQFKILDDELVPIDIDAHIINYNERLDLPEHYHFEFRYLFEVEEIRDINIDKKELEKFKWIDIDEIKKDKNYGRISQKIERILNKENNLELIEIDIEEFENKIYEEYTKLFPEE